MTKKTLIGMLLCSVMLVCAVKVHGDSLAPGRWWRSPELSKDLGLTEKEKQVLDDMYVKNRTALIDLRSDLEKERLKLEASLEKDPFNESAAISQLKRVEERRQKLSYERFKFIIESRKILGAERFRMLSDKFEEMRKSRHSGSSSGRRSDDRRY